MAKAFAEAIEDYSSKGQEQVWNLCLRLVDVTPDEAPVGDPKEFLPFCGTVAIGAIGSVSPTFLGKALSHLRELAGNPRWRTREAVAMGIQELLARQSRTALERLEGWIVDNEWLPMRAVVAGVAEPALLKDKEIALKALEFHRKVFSRIIATEERKSEGFRILRQGLGYSLSVVVCAVPEEGFEYVRQITGSRDADVLWIVRENLKKNRLLKNFPQKVASIKKLAE